jgi:hypothetical protein
MPVRSSPATVVILASQPRQGGGSARTVAGLTRVVDLETLLGGGDDGADSALAIDPRWLASRQTLRQSLVRARHAAPRLEAAVLRGAALEHHALLAEEGIRAVLVDEFAAVGRGPRRPAPAGWPCRNVAWGLWEVRSCPPRRGRGWRWLPGLPAPRVGALHAAVASAGDLRLVDWAARAVARGQAVAVTLAGLPAILEGRAATPPVASVLKAA